MAISRVFETELVVKEQHLDAFGHVNNAKYLEILEQARWDYIAQNGYGFDVIKELKQGPVILEVTLSFKRELVNRQHVRILSAIQSYEKKIAVMTQDIVDDEGRVCCAAKFLIGLFDLSARKLIEPTPAWKKALGIDTQ